jgi:hypothetical protein
MQYHVATWGSEEEAPPRRRAPNTMISTEANRFLAGAEFAKLDSHYIGRFLGTDEVVVRFH